MKTLLLLSALNIIASSMLIMNGIAHDYNNSRFDSWQSLSQSREERSFSAIENNSKRLEIENAVLGRKLAEINETSDRLKIILEEQEQIDIIYKHAAFVKPQKQTFISMLFG